MLKALRFGVVNLHFGLFNDESDMLTVWWPHYLFTPLNVGEQRPKHLLAAVQVAYPEALRGWVDTRMISHKCDKAMVRWFRGYGNAGEPKLRLTARCRKTNGQENRNRRDRGSFDDAFSSIHNHPQSSARAAVPNRPN
jgi:hypothetical protein